MEAVTPRRLAKELQTGPASLYACVRTLQIRRALVLDRMLADVDLHPASTAIPAPGWRQSAPPTCTCCCATTDSPGSRPACCPMAKNAIALTDRGAWAVCPPPACPPLRAAWGYDALMLHVTSIAAELDRRRSQRDPVDRARNAHEDGADKRFRHASACTRSRSPAPRRSASRGRWTSC